MNKREEAIKWWEQLSPLRKTQICDTNTKFLGSVRRWETLSVLEIEMLYDDECSSDYEIIRELFESI